MNGHIVTSFVSDFDDQSVSIVDFQCWARELAIHRDSVVGVAQPLHWRCFNLFHYNQLGNYFLTKKSKKLNKKKISPEKIIEKEKEGERTYNKLVLVNFGIC